ncbi:MAG TPA: fumarylacetoacetate hydrolase family protein [Steroidobacter sp.]|uniref:fumarylacetoacetate hydrolase family protein n=1 Tax=Steroidobacter sp. TaxID=1978227 RepID=UPI002ED8EAA2
MKIVTFEVATPLGKVTRLGAWIEHDGAPRVVDLNAAFTSYLITCTDEPTPREYAALRIPPDMVGWLRAGAEGRRAAMAAIDYAQSQADRCGHQGARLLYDRSEVRLLAPLPRPSSFRAFSIYEEHMTRAQVTPMTGGDRPYRKSVHWFRTPPYYKGSCTSFAGPDDPVPFPYYTEKLDLELEIAIVIGREARNLSVAEVPSCIAGYAMLIDSSCRDGYGREPFGPTKRKDFHTALGPWLVTPEELDIQNLACSIEADGKVCFAGSTAAPHSFTPAQLVAYASDNETLYPGDLLATGTISYGCSMDHHHWFRVGQEVTFRIEGLGAMTLKIVAGERVVEHVRGMQGLLPIPPDLQ